MEAMVLFCITLTVLSPILGDRLDMLSIKDYSWISNENFTTLIQLSFPFSKCCNIYFSESMQDDAKIFNQFRKIYPYTYVLGRRIYECQGYFLLGRSSEEIVKHMNDVPTLISTTEILIILNGNVESNFSIFNTSLYGYANVNIVSVSGMWTLTENYLSPRAFEKHHRFDEMIHDYDRIDLGGRELQVASTYRRPFSYLFTTTMKIINGIQAEVYTLDNDDEKGGIEHKLLEVIAEKLNSTFTIRTPSGYNKYGTRNGSKWNGGMMQMLIEREVDLAFGGIWLSQDNNAFVKLSVPWYEINVHLVVPRPKPRTSFWALAKPFSWTVWFLLIFALLLISLYTYFRALFDDKLPTRFRNFVVTLTEFIGSLLGTFSPKEISALKLQMTLWQTAGWLLIAAYSCNLAAILTSWEYEDRIDTIQQFLDANLTVDGTPLGTEVEEMFDLTDPLIIELLKKRGFTEDEDLLEGTYSVATIVMESRFYLHLRINPEHVKNLRLMRESVASHYPSFAVQPWLLTPVDRVILWLRQSGIPLFYLRDDISFYENFDLREIFLEHDGNDGIARVLDLKPLAVGFSILLIGLSISTLVFFLELRHAGKRKPNRKVFRNVVK